jgi:peptidoglycan hydrolase-like protein with peptidoglycan-binding domain
LKSNLKRYNESSDVLALQNFLVDKGFLNAKPNGYFGSGTLSAVKKYQKSIGLSQSGQVFPLTRATIKKETCGSISTNSSNNSQTNVQQNTVTTTTKPVITPAPVVVTPSVPLTSNQKRQQDVINLLNAMYNFYLDSNGTFPVTYITVVPVEVCALGISECDKIVEVKSSLVSKFLTRIPTDPTITSTSSMGTGYFITRSLYGEIKITAPKSDSKEDIFATCNFSIKCKITTAKDVSTVLGKPNIDSISKTTFFSGGVMSIPLTINGTNFSSSSNTVSLIHQNNRKVFNLGTYPSATGTIIIATSSFTYKAFPCGYSCSEIPSAGSYEVTVKTSSGESNVGYISLQGVNATSYSNGNDTSFIPKSTHVKLGTVAISSSALIDIKGLNIRASSEPINIRTVTNVKNQLNSVVSTTTLPSLSTKISNYTLTDSLTGTVINGGPLFVLTNQKVSNNQSKIYEIYANIAEIENVQAGQVIFSGEFVVEDNITQSKTTVPFPNFVISISY